MSDKIRAIIVDDEELSRLALRQLLADHLDVEVIAECANGFEAVRAVNDLKPELIFLDIQMPKLNGFEVLELIGADAPVVVFVTAYDEFALEAFRVHAEDYLLKPVAPERLTSTLDHVRLLTTSSQRNYQALLAAARPREACRERILVRDGARVNVIPVGKIDYIQAQDDYVLIRAEGRRFLKTQALSELEQELDPARFVRIHRSYLLNVERLARLDQQGKESWTAVLDDNTELPVSRAGHARLKELLE